MKALNLFLYSLGGILASECPAGCDCVSNNIMAICISATKLTEFPDISRSPDIEEFLLVENAITNLPRLAHGLPRLRILNLSKNELIKISRGSLPMSIEDAWMDDNHVKSISSRIFSNLPNIMRIYLRNVSYAKYFLIKNFCWKIAINPKPKISLIFHFVFVGYLKDIMRQKGQIRLLF